MKAVNRSYRVRYNLLVIFLRAVNCNQAYQFYLYNSTSDCFFMCSIYPNNRATFFLLKDAYMKWAKKELVWTTEKSFGKKQEKWWQDQMTWNDRLSFCQNDSKKNASQCVEILSEWAFLFSSNCVLKTNILFTESRIKFRNYKSGFFSRNLLFVLIWLKQFLAQMQERWELPSWALIWSFDLLLDFVLKTALIRSEHSTNFSKINRKNLVFVAGSHG